MSQVVANAFCCRTYRVDRVRVCCLKCVLVVCAIVGVWWGPLISGCCCYTALRVAEHKNTHWSCKQTQASSRYSGSTVMRVGSSTRVRRILYCKSAQSCVRFYYLWEPVYRNNKMGPSRVSAHERAAVRTASCCVCRTYPYNGSTESPCGRCRNRP